MRGLEKTPGGRRLSRGEKLLLLVLADLYNDHKRAAWPSLAMLAKDAMCTREFASRALNRLADEGVLVVCRRSDQKSGTLANEYQFVGLHGVIADPPIDLRSIGGIDARSIAIDVRDQPPIDVRDQPPKEETPVEPPSKQNASSPAAECQAGDTPAAPADDAREKGRPRELTPEDLAIGDALLEAIGRRIDARERRRARDLAAVYGAQAVVLGIWTAAARARQPIRSFRYCEGAICEVADAKMGAMAQAAALASARRIVAQRRGTQAEAADQPPP